MPRPRTISNQQILDAAKRCFLDQGPHVSMEVIAEDLGVSSQAILKRFGSKQEVMLAAMAPADEAAWIPLVEAGPSDQPIRQQLTEILEELATFFVQLARQISVLRFSGIDPRDLMSRYDEAPPLRDIRILAAWLDQAAQQNFIRQIDSRAMAMMMLTSMHGPAMLTDMLGKHPTGHSQSQYVNFVVDIVLQGLESNSTDAQSAPAIDDSKIS
ncbi:MAG: TetR/AcrR family transcriptional regulator [Fuerstiella sp.]